MKEIPEKQKKKDAEGNRWRKEGKLNRKSKET